MATASSVIRQIQGMIGDQGGRAISKEIIVDLINEESERVLARFPKSVRVTGDQTLTDSYQVTVTGLDPKRIAIQEVFIDTFEVVKMRSSDMERITQE